MAYDQITANILREIEQLRDERDALLRALEVIAVGDSKDPVTDAGDELVALGYWRGEAVAAMRAGKAGVAAPVVPPGYHLVMVPDLQPADEPDWDECIRQAEVATGLKVERHTLSIVIREVRRWLAGRTAGVDACAEPQQEGGA